MRISSIIAILCLSVSSLFAYDESILPEVSDQYQFSFFNGKNPATGSLKSQFLKQLRDTFDLSIFIETGTYLGDTTAIAAEVFPGVHTVELAQDLYQKAVKRFAYSNVQVHLGDSSDVFPLLLPSIEDKALFYLDGHYSGDITAKGEEITPILNELSKIKEAGLTQSVILIDDVRLFQKSLYEAAFDTNSPSAGYPPLEKVIDAILTINPSYKIAIFGDIIMAYPPEKGALFSPLFHACIKERAFYGRLSEQEITDLESIISHAEGSELEQLIEYYKHYSVSELQLGFRSFSSLWRALTLQNAGKTNLAQMIFTLAAQRSYADWPITRHYLNPRTIHN